MAKKKIKTVKDYFTIRAVIDILARYDVAQNSMLIDTSKKEKKFYGFLDFDKKIIYISDNLSDKMRRQTLIHELVHVIKHENGLKDIEKETEEDEKEIFEKIFKEKPRTG